MPVKVTSEMVKNLGYAEGTTVKAVQAEFDAAEKLAAARAKWFIAGRSEAAK